MDAVNSNDVDAYVDLLTEDVVWIPPGQPALSGRKAFAAWVRPFFESYRYEFAVAETDVRMAGDWAVEHGQFMSSMESLEDGSKGEHAGRYLVLWRREPDDRWRIERYLDVTSR